jgi:hypothetical protein
LDRITYGLVREAGNQQSVAQACDRLLGIHVQVQELRHGDGADCVVDGSERAQRREQLVGLRLVAEVEGLDEGE